MYVGLSTYWVVQWSCLHKWMPFVIFHARSRGRSQRHFRADFWVCVASRCVNVYNYNNVEKTPSIKVHRAANHPFFSSKSKFNFSSVSSSLVLCLSAVVGCSSLLSRVKPLAKGWFQLASVSWPSCRQQASLFMHGYGRAAFPFLLQIILLFQILGRRCHIFQSIKDPPF